MEGITRRSMVAASVAALASAALPMAAVANEEEDGTSDMSEAEGYGVKMLYPSEWTLTDTGSALCMGDGTGDFLVTVSSKDIGQEYASDEEASKELFTMSAIAFVSSMPSCTSDYLRIEVGDESAWCDLYYSSVSDEQIYGLLRFAWKGSSLLVASTASAGIYTLADNRDVFEEIWDSIEF